MIAREAALTPQARESGKLSGYQDSRHQDDSRRSNLGGLLEIAMEIAEKRSDIIRRMRTALLNRNDTEALDYARQLCGVGL